MINGIKFNFTIKRRKIGSVGPVENVNGTLEVVPSTPNVRITLDGGTHEYDMYTDDIINLGDILRQVL